jgi:hypothetical protein
MVLLLFTRGKEQEYPHTKKTLAKDGHYRHHCHLGEESSYLRHFFGDGHDDEMQPLSKGGAALSPKARDHATALNKR